MNDILLNLWKIEKHDLIENTVSLEYDGAFLKKADNIRNYIAYLEDYT